MDLGDGGLDGGVRRGLGVVVVEPARLGTDQRRHGGHVPGVVADHLGQPFGLVVGVVDVAEVYRAGLESIHWSQVAAARSLGLSQTKTLRFVVVPQAVRRIIPPLMNDFVALQKDTSLVSLIGVPDLINRARSAASREASLAPYVAAGIAFLIITIPFTRLTDYLLERDHKRRSAGG